MTTEDDFQKVLAAKPNDWQTRLVFADWLQEHDDPRAEGYRAMGQLRLVPEFFKGADAWVWLNAHWASSYDDKPVTRAATLPDDWYNLLPRYKKSPECAEERRELSASLNDAARAFAKLPPERRTELLDPAYKLPRVQRARKKRAAKKPTAKAATAKKPSAKKPAAKKAKAPKE